MAANLLELENSALRKEIQELKASSLEYQKDFHESHTWFKKVFHSSLLGNKIISSDLKILQANQALADLLGYESVNDIIGTRITDYTPPEGKAGWKLLQQNLWNNSTPSFSLETCLQKKDGSLFWCHATSILFEIKGETYGFSILEDCTENHNLRRQKEEFVNVASHELKTPITSLKARLQVINRAIANTEIDPALIKMFRDAEKSTSKLDHLVCDLLNLTKLEQENFILNKAPFLLNDLVDGCRNHIESLRDFRLTFQGDVGLEVVADRFKLEQILINLINNAIKYAPGSKEIVVTAEKLNQDLKISVRDFGDGVSADHLEHIFTRYYRADKDNIKTSGLGIGLYVSNEIIKRHGGEMGANNNTGGGSTFWFSIPVE